jgi:hypothetical protein
MRNVTIRHITARTVVTPGLIERSRDPIPSGMNPRSGGPIMTMSSTIARRAAWAVSLAAALVLAGCAAKTQAPVVTATAAKAPAAKAAPVGTVLEYKMPEGRMLSYQNTGEALEATDMMGQSVESHTTSSEAFTLRAKGRKEGNLLLGVTIDDMSMTITSPRGDMSPDMTSLAGKTFDMVLSPLGQEVDVSGAEALTYKMATGTRNLATTFKLFFPDLPEKPLKVGDVWPSSGGAEEKTGAVDLRLAFQNVNHFEGLETVDGIECARIRSEVTATITGSGSQQGMDMVFSGTGQGTDLWYFAVKDGIYVKSTGDLKMDMSITVSAMGMTIPVTTTRKGTVQLVGRK